MTCGVICWPGRPPFSTWIAELQSEHCRVGIATTSLQDRFWTTCYPMAAIIEVMRLVERARQTVVAELLLSNL